MKNLIIIPTYWAYNQEHILEGFDPRQRKWLKKYQPEIVYEVPANGLIFLYTNKNSDKMSDVRVRRAISLATDQRLLASRIYKTMNPLFCFVPFSNDDFHCLDDEAKFQEMEDRLEKAKELMVQAGFAERPLEVNLLVSRHSGYEYAVAAVINIWKRINIDATAIIDEHDQSADITLTSWSSRSSNIDEYLDDFMNLARDLNENAGVYNNIDRKQKNELNKSRVEFRLFEEALAEQHYFIPVSRLYWRYLVKEDIEGWGQSINGFHPTRRLSRKKE